MSSARWLWIALLATSCLHPDRGGLREPIPDMSLAGPARASYAAPEPGGRYHAGVDVRPPDARLEGDVAVRAAAEGRVDLVAWAGSSTQYCDGSRAPAVPARDAHLGNTVVLGHEDGSRTLYARLRCLEPGLEPGALVRSKAPIGRLASDGWLHFAVLDRAAPGAARDALVAHTEGLPDGFGFRDPAVRFHPFRERQVSPEVLEVRPERLRVRSGPGLEYAQLAWLRRGQRVVVHARSGEWGRVDLADSHGLVSGWIATSGEGQPLLEAVPEAVHGRVIAGSELARAPGRGRAPVRVWAGQHVVLTGSVREGGRLWLRTELAGAGPAWIPAESLELAEPPPPASLQIATEHGVQRHGVELRWSEVPMATAYEVWRSERASRQGARLVRTSETHFVDTAAEPDRAYYYRVRSLRGERAGELGPPREGRAGLLVPEAPRGLAAGDGTALDGVELSWEPAAGAEVYEVWRLGTGEREETLLGTTSSLRFRDLDAELGHAYGYRVRARNAAGLGPFGEPDAGYRSLPAPEDLRASRGRSSERVELEWSPVPGAAGYELLRSEDRDGEGVALATTLEPRFEDRLAPPGRVVHYRVRAVGASGPGVAGPPAEGYRALPQPERVAAGDGEIAEGVPVEWTPVPGAEGYEVWREHEARSTAALLARVQGTTYLDAGAAPGVPHRYRVRATDASFPGSWSAPDIGWRGLAAPSRVTTTDQAGGVVVHWTPVAGARGYELWRSTGKGAGSLVGSSLDARLADEAATAGRTYHYRVRAVGPAGTGPFSEAVAGARSLAAPPAPRDLAASDGTSTHAVQLAWSPSPGASEYEVWRFASAPRDGSDEGGVRLGMASAASFEDREAAPEIAYLYRVRARNAGGRSAPSPPDEGHRSVSLRAPAGPPTVELRATPPTSRGVRRCASSGAPRAPTAARRPAPAGDGSLPPASRTSHPSRPPPTPSRVPDPAAHRRARSG